MQAHCVISQHHRDKGRGQVDKYVISIQTNWRGREVASVGVNRDVFLAYEGTTKEWVRVGDAQVSTIKPLVPTPVAEQP